MDNDINDLLQAVHDAHMREVEADARMKRDLQVQYRKRREELKLATARAARRAFAAGATKGNIGLSVGLSNYTSIDSLLEYGNESEG